MELATQLQELLHISYYLNQFGWYHVTLHYLGQEIAVPAFEIKRILGIEQEVDLGCCEISTDQAIDLGFIFQRNYIRFAPHTI